MRRRQLLSTLSGASALALAGCLSTDQAPEDGTGPAGTPSATSGESHTGTQPGGSAGGGEASSTPRTVPPRRGTPTPTPTLGSPFPRQVTVESVDDGPLRQTYDVAAGVESVDGEVTAGDTARVAICLRTTGDRDRRLTYEKRECGRNQLRASSANADLFLLPAGSDPSQDEAYSAGELDCPVAGHGNLSCGIPVVEETVTVPASGDLTWRFDVWVPPSNVEHGICVAPGRYRFERPFSADDETATLSFALRVTAPG